MLDISRAAPAQAFPSSIPIPAPKNAGVDSSPAAPVDVFHDSTWIVRIDVALPLDIVIVTAFWVALGLVVKLALQNPLPIAGIVATLSCLALSGAFFMVRLTQRLRSWHESSAELLHVPAFPSETATSWRPAISPSYLMAADSSQEHDQPLLFTNRPPRLR